MKSFRRPVLIVFNSPLHIILDHETVASVCVDLGTCYYNSGMILQLFCIELKAEGGIPLILEAKAYSWVLIFYDLY